MSDNEVLKSIQEEQIFNYLKENLGVNIEKSSKLVGGIGGYSEDTLNFELSLKNPKTGQREIIIDREFSLD